MRLIDADELMERLRKRFYAHDLKSDFDRCARSVVLSCMEATQRAATIWEPPNDPLTLEELREMDGEPAYFQFGDGTQGWAIVEKDVSGIILYGPDFDDHTYPDDDFINMEHNDPAGHFGLHVLGWRAYRRKPEEGAT